jgi:hypothetical protein
MNHAFLASTAICLSALDGCSAAEERIETTAVLIDNKLFVSGLKYCVALRSPCRASILHGNTSIGFSKYSSVYACKRIGTKIEL